MPVGFATMFATRISRQSGRRGRNPYLAPAAVAQPDPAGSATCSEP